MKKLKVKLLAIWAIIRNPTFYLYVSKGDDAATIHHDLSVADAKTIASQTKTMGQEAVDDYHQEEFLTNVKNHLTGAE